MLKTILIADDDPAVIRVIVQSFQKYEQKYNILQAHNGKIACQIAKKQKPDLIILDWMMPIMSGVDALNELQVQESTKDIPVIITTGTMTEDKHLSEALRRGAIDYLRKPISALELTSRTQTALQLSESYLQIKEQNQEIKQLALREKELLKNILDHKTRELSTILIQLQNKNNLLLQIKELLSSNISTENITKALNLIHKDTNLDSQWGKFKLHFEQVHANFFSKLQKIFPHLNDNDLRLCAYIKMQLSNKEIANLLSLSVKGIEAARYRLKKRLNLSTEQDLNGFIRNFY